jgi:hypothetical protein
MQQGSNAIDHEHGFGFAKENLVRMSNGGAVTEGIQNVDDVRERSHDGIDVRMPGPLGAHRRMALAQQSEEIGDTRILRSGESSITH